MSYIAGLMLALVLSIIAFALVHWRVVNDRTVLLQTIFGLGLLQAIVHFRSFLHVSFKRSSRDDLLLILFSAVIIAVMAGGTIVLMFNLRDRMM